MGETLETVQSRLSSVLVCGLTKLMSLELCGSSTYCVISRINFSIKDRMKVKTYGDAEHCYSIDIRR
ncbi:uncharacterized protein Bfra_005462 [Botrytis fragariae]|uniref:Uncharacterized protein n=1 Tax=Botrytis fragariae TaxID=1964551 RepID=A0A8H6AV63_9HELO|nr:uncharacterized protein Bfra_005462 [Botrytis fragariae]KAF5873995.1 hypothetical protein Bfra_005462 [Botrytis fragariae]